MRAVSVCFIGLAAASLVASPAIAQSAGEFIQPPRSSAVTWYGPTAVRSGAEGSMAMSGLLFGTGSGLGFNPARRESGFRADPSRLRGQGLALDMPPPDGTFIGYRFDRLTLTSGIRQRHDAAEAVEGTRLDLGASYGFNPNPRHLITLAGRLTLGQSRPPGLPIGTYTADAMTRSGLQAGEPGMGLRLSWTYSPDDRLFVNTSLGFGRLQAGADPAQSFDRSTTTFGTTFGYRW